MKAIINAKAIHEVAGIGSSCPIDLNDEVTPSRTQSGWPSLRLGETRQYEGTCNFPIRQIPTQRAHTRLLSCLMTYMQAHSALAAPVRAELQATGPLKNRQHRLLALQRLAGNQAVSSIAAPASVFPSSTAQRRSTVQRLGLAAFLFKGLSGRTEPAGFCRPVQRDLETSIRQQVQTHGPPHYDGIVRQVRAAPLAERRAVLNDSRLMQSLGNWLGPTHATTVASLLLQDMYKWQNPPGNDFFKFFVMGQGAGPASPSSTMNCWESVMYAAFLVGVVSKAWIRSFYTRAMGEPDPNAAAYALLGWSAALPRRDKAAGKEPSVGQLLFYRSGPGVPGHVALYLGGDEIMSLWTQPHGVDHIQRVGIDEIAGNIYYGDPPW